MRTAMHHYDRIFGSYGLSPQDAARYVFASGWNACLQEMLTRALEFQLDEETRGVLSEFLDGLRHIDESDLH